jgi:hypothetical protein
MAMKVLKAIYDIWCQGLLASHLTRRGKWRSAVKLIQGKPNAV